MFNLQGSEIVIILLLALVVLGPEKLPDAMRRAGKAYSELKKMSSGFQQEFRSVVDEPMREIRDTANVLRDSADFTKLQDGGRAEKPKSAEMAPADPDAVPTDDTPTFEPPDGPTTSSDSEPAPFEEIEPAPREPISTEPTPIPVVKPFTGMSSAAPRPDDERDPAAGRAGGDDGAATDHGARDADVVGHDSVDAERAGTDPTEADAAPSDSERESAGRDGER